MKILFAAPENAWGGFLGLIRAELPEHHFEFTGRFAVDTLKGFDVLIPTMSSVSQNLLETGEQLRLIQQCGYTGCQCAHRYLRKRRFSGGIGHLYDNRSFKGCSGNVKKLCRAEYGPTPGKGSERQNHRSHRSRWNRTRSGKKVKSLWCSPHRYQTT